MTSFRQLMRIQVSSPPPRRRQLPAARVASMVELREMTGSYREVHVGALTDVKTSDPGPVTVARPASSGGSSESKVRMA